MNWDVRKQSAGYPLGYGDREENVGSRNSCDVVSIASNEMLSAPKSADGTKAASLPHVAKNIDGVFLLHGVVPPANYLGTHLSCVGEGPATMPAQRIIAEM